MVGVLCGEANKRTMCIGLDKWLVRRVAVLRETFSTINIILFELERIQGEPAVLAGSCLASMDAQFGLQKPSSEKTPSMLPSRQRQCNAKFNFKVSS